MTEEEKSELKQKYYDYVNHKLPQELLPGIAHAMEIYRDKYNDDIDFDDDEAEGNAVCIIIAEDLKTMAFAVGDGLDLEDGTEEEVFYSCEYEMFETLANWCEDTGLNLKQEVSHWLGDAISLAEEEGLFDDFDDFAVYGDFGYGSGEYDVFYEAMSEDWDDDDDDDDWDDEDEDEEEDWDEDDD